MANNLYQEIDEIITATIAELEDLQARIDAGEDVDAEGEHQGITFNFNEELNALDGDAIFQLNDQQRQQLMERALTFPDVEGYEGFHLAQDLQRLFDELPFDPDAALGENENQLQNPNQINNQIIQNPNQMNNQIIQNPNQMNNQFQQGNNNNQNLFAIPPLDEEEEEEHQQGGKKRKSRKSKYNKKTRKGKKSKKSKKTKKSRKGKKSRKH